LAIPGPSVLILGMHRSGTSCLAGSLEARGLALGEVSRSDPHNARGNRENLAVRELNEAVLEHSGGAWDSPPDVVAWTQELRARRDKLLAERMREAPGLWGFKDPRTLITLPFWLAALRQPLLVGTFRHPLPVAHSLQARSGMSLEAGLALWSVYNERLLGLRRVRRFPILRFDVEASNYRAGVERLVHDLGLATDGAGADFRDETLVHHSAEGEQLDPRIAQQWSELNDFADRS